MKLEICIKKLNGIVIDKDLYPTNTLSNRQIAMSLNAEMMNLGYIMSNDMLSFFSLQLNQNAIAYIAETIIPTLKYIKGADVNYEPMYPNFPKQVMEASELELFINAILHYFTHGEWKPNYHKLPRKYEFENVKFKEINIISQDDYLNFFTKLLSSNESLSEEDKKIVTYYLDNESDLRFPEAIPYKETMCIIATDQIKKQRRNVVGIVKTATDVLRIATYMSGGDISLATNTKFKSLPRKTRRVLVMALERVISEEDINRHRNKWCKLFHNLHVGDYSKKVYQIASKVRNNQKLYTINSKVQEMLDKKEYVKASKLLTQRPGEFARRLDYILRKSNSIESLVVIDNFSQIVDKISTRVLTQLSGHLKGRCFNNDRIVFPKGSIQRAINIGPHNSHISNGFVRAVYDIIDVELVKRFSKLEPLKNVWIDPRLDRCPLPTQQRSASTGYDIVGRGTRLPIGDKNTLRFFIYWVGKDIDLSATMHNQTFDITKHISYTSLRDNNTLCCHSGDITQARNGASEFIDINIEAALKDGIRYICMNVLVYSGPTFKEHEKCYAGWMAREHVNSNEIYDPKTIISKVDLVSDTKNIIPVIFDLEKREAIWTDLVTKQNNHRGGNNVESNRANITDVMKCIINIQNKFTLHNLALLHASARGEIVVSKEEANFTFGLEDCNITPYNINTINSELLV